MSKMSEQEFDTWVSKTKLWFVLNGLSFEKYYKGDRYFQPCNYCPLDKGDACVNLDITTLWVDREGVIQVNQRSRLEKMTKGNEGARCLEWIKHV
jgi:hypothetical protein